MRVPSIQRTSPAGLFVDDLGRLVATCEDRVITIDGDAAWFREASRMLARAATMKELGTLASAPTVGTMTVEPERRRRG